MPAFELSEWNDLIDEINDIRANPPEDTDCEPLDPIEHYENPSSFPKSEVRRVRDALKETCDSIEFPELESPQLIKRSLLEDIRDQFDQAWCDCEDEDPEECEEFFDSFTTIVPASEPIINPGTGLPSGGIYHIADLAVAMPYACCIGTITKVGAGSPSGSFTNAVQTGSFICGWPDCEVEYVLQCVPSGGGPGGGGGGG